MKYAVLLLGLGVVAWYLVSRGTVQAAPPGSPSSAPPPSVNVHDGGAIGDSGVVFSATLCKIGGKVDFTGQCAQLNDPVYRAAVGQGYHDVFTTAVVPKLAYTSIKTFSNPVTVVKSFGGATQHCSSPNALGQCRDWRTGKWV